MIIQMQCEAARALLAILVKLTLVHVVELLGQSWGLSLEGLLLLVVSHILREKIVIEVFLTTFQHYFNTLGRISL
jgi:hypothetical protein